MKNIYLILLVLITVILLNGCNNNEPNKNINNQLKTISSTSPINDDKAKDVRYYTYLLLDTNKLVEITDTLISFKEIIPATNIKLTLTMPTKYYDSIHDIAYAPSTNKFIAVGDNFNTKNSIIYFSSDGSNWMQITSPYEKNSRLTKVKWIEELKLFIAIGSNQFFPNDDAKYKTIICISEDGIDWKPIQIDADSKLNDLEWIGKELLIVGKDNNLSGILIRTKDGKTWNIDDTPPVNHEMNAIVYNGKQIIIVGGYYTDVVDAHNFILVSENGTDWQITESSDSPLKNIIWENQQFIITAEGGGFIQLSPNGNKWTNIMVDVDYIVYVNNEFIGTTRYSFPNRGFMISPNGIKWIPYKSNTSENKKK